MGSGGRSMCPLGRKVMPSDTEGRFRLERPAPAPAPATVSWTGDRRGLQVSQGLPGRAPGAPPAKMSGAAVGWGLRGRRVPAWPGTAAWCQTAYCWCVSLASIFCVRLCMMCSSVPRLRIPGTPKLPADCVLVLGNGLSCDLRPGAAETFRVRTRALRRHLCAAALQRAARKRRAGGGASWVTRWAVAGVQRGRCPRASVTFFLSVFLSFSLCAKLILTSHSFAKPSRLYG